MTSSASDTHKASVSLCVKQSRIPGTQVILHVRGRPFTEGTVVDAERRRTSKSKVETNFSQSPLEETKKKMT